MPALALGSLLVVTASLARALYKRFAMSQTSLCWLLEYHSSISMSISNQIHHLIQALDMTKPLTDSIITITITTMQRRSNDKEMPEMQLSMGPAHEESKVLSKMQVTARLQAPKLKARSIVHEALRKGELVKPRRCSMCHRGRTVLHAHHLDYSRALKVIWLCVDCHLKEHGKSIRREGDVTFQVSLAGRLCDSLDTLRFRLGITRNGVIADALDTYIALMKAKTVKVTE